MRSLIKLNNNYNNYVSVVRYAATLRDAIFSSYTDDDKFFITRKQKQTEKNVLKVM